MESANKFQDLKAWFSNTVSSSHTNRWEVNGGICTDDIFDANYFFSDNLVADDVQRILKKNSNLIIFKPEWIDNSLQNAGGTIDSFISFQEQTPDVTEEEKDKAWALFQKEIRQVNDQKSETNDQQCNTDRPRQTRYSKRKSIKERNEHEQNQGTEDSQKPTEPTERNLAQVDDDILANNAKKTKKKQKGIENSCKEARSSHRSGFLYGSFEDFIHIDDLLLPDMSIKDFVINKNGCQVKLI